MKSKVGIREIAEKLNLGKTTVSVALRDKYGVNEDTKSKIILTAIEMGYDFNKLQSKSKQQKSVKLVLSDKSFLTTLFWTDIIKGIEKECSKRGLIVDVFATKEHLLFSDLFEDILKGTSLGIIFIDIFINEEYKIFKDLSIPVVLVDPREYLGTKFTQIKSNNYLGGYNVCEYLWKMGHRKLCFIGKENHGQSIRMRYKGFTDAFMQLNKNNEGEFYALTAPEDNHPEYMHSHEQIRREFGKGIRPTGIFCANDMVGFRTIEQLKNEFHLECPRDISIVGFDNVEEFSCFSPKLTTVDVNKEEMGKIAVDVMFDEKENKSKSKLSIELNCNIIERDSVRNLNI